VGLFAKEHFANDFRVTAVFLKKDDEYDARTDRIIQMVETAGIKAKTVRYLASGDDSDTFLCDEAYVVKVPRREAVRHTQARIYAV
jgi:hypothetical protein